MPYVYLALAIFTEIFGTTLIKASAGFSKIYPFLGGMVCFVLSLYFMTFSFKTISLSVGYAIWSGVGTAGAVIIGVLIWNETISVVGLCGLLFIVLGITLLNMTPA